MNNEEKHPIFELHEQYSKVFNLEGNTLTFTNAAKHEIKLIGIKCLVYLDDIIVYKKNVRDYNNKLNEVFERLK